jgi:RNA polymerase sigma factor (TIGR02999 family)
MAAFRNGDSEAGTRLMELFYPELKRLAAGQLRRESPGHSWQPTVLVNELYLQMVKIKALPERPAESKSDKVVFLSLAGHIMKRLLIHHARLLSSKAQKLPLFEELQAQETDSAAEVEHLLRRLQSIKPILRSVVEQKVFEGKTADEIAAEIGVSAVTIHRHWQFARHWLKNEWAV